MSACSSFFWCNFVICDPDLHMLCPRWSGLGYWTLFIHVVEFSRTLTLEERAAYLHVPILSDLDWAVMLPGLYRRGGESGNDELSMLTFSNKVTKLPAVLIYLAVFIRLCVCFVSSDLIEFSSCKLSYSYFVHLKQGRVSSIDLISVIQALNGDISSQTYVSLKSKPNK